MKKIWKRSLICILKVLGIGFVLAVSLIPARYMNSMYGYVPVIFILTILSLSAFSLLWIRRKITFTCNEEGVMQCEMGSIEPISVKVRNTSHLYCPKAVAAFYITDLSGHDLARKNIIFPISGKGENDFNFEVLMEHVGVYRTGIKQLELYDLLQLFHLTVPKGKYNRVCVIPKLRDMDIAIDAEEFLVESQKSRKAAVNDGYDYTGVREYEIGDSMKTIHWKLSSIGHGYMTKVKESTRQGNVAVILDVLTWEYDKNAARNVYDCLAETAFSIIAGLWSKEAGYSLLFNNRDNEAVRVIPKSPCAFAEVVEELSMLCAKPSNDFLGGLDLLDKEIKRGLCSVIVLCTAYVDETLIQKLVSIKQKRRRPILFYILSPDLSQRDREMRMAPLKILDEASIEYHIRIPGKNSYES